MEEKGQTAKGMGSEEPPPYSEPPPPAAAYEPPSRVAQPGPAQPMAAQPQQPVSVTQAGGVSVIHTGQMGGPAAQNVVIVQQPGGGMTNNRYPAHMVCPHCQQTITTRVEYRINTCVWIWCVVLFFTTLIFAWVPFVISSCKDVHHTCPNCNKNCGQRLY